jgi:hypothetical protein
MEPEKSENHINDEETALDLVAPFHRSRGLEAVADMLDQYNKQNAALMTNIVGATGVHNKLGRIVDSLALASGLAELIVAQELSSISKSAYLPAYEILDSANFSICKLYSSSNAIVEAFKSIPSISESWQSQFASINLALEIAQPSKFVVESHLAQISELSILTQSSLSHLNWERLGNTLQLTTNIQAVLQHTFLDFTKAYSDLYGNLRKQPSIIASLPVFASELPAVELFNETSLLESITIQEEDDFEFTEHKQKFRGRIQTGTNDRLAELLAILDKDLLSLWEGARFSLNSDNPDRARHFAISLRELFTQVLHTLAPDTEVKVWTNNPKHYQR